MSRREAAPSPRRGEQGPERSDHRFVRARRVALTGWGLFVVSALFFTASSLRSGDMLALLGSVFFLVACFVFLIPILRDSHEH